MTAPPRPGDHAGPPAQLTGQGLPAAPDGTAADGTGPQADPSSELRELAGDCVHCGFCLPACPTYQLWGEEMDSPRGPDPPDHPDPRRRAGSEPVVTHLDRCLGCMACVPACPSGVRYDRLIEAARSWTEAGRRPGAAGPARLPAPVAPGPGRPRRDLRHVPLPAPAAAHRPAAARPADRADPAGPAQQAGRPVRAGAGRVPAHRPGPTRPFLRDGAGCPGIVLRNAPTRRPATARTGRIPAGPRRATVGLLTGCVQRVFFPGVNDATARVLAAAGCDVVIPARQGCCGALSLHTGRTAEAARFARRTIAVFEAADVDVIVVNSAGCGSAMKEYSHLLGTGSGGAVSKVRDLSEYLAELAGGSAGTGFSLQAFPVRAMYHEACHLGNAQGIRSQPRDLLRAIPGLELVESGDGGVCCGSAGVYNLLQPEADGELGAGRRPRCWPRELTWSSRPTPVAACRSRRPWLTRELPTRPGSCTSPRCWTRPSAACRSAR